MKDTKALEAATIADLRQMQLDRRLTITAMAQRIGVNREKLRRALHGERIWWVDATYIENWLADQKAAVAAFVADQKEGR